MEDVFGQAMLDFHQKVFKPPLKLHTEYGPPETVAIEHFFAEEDKFSDLEFFALDQAKGKILDIGAASGRHALHLQNQGKTVTALDFSSKCGIIMKEAGIKNVVTEDIYQHKGGSYNTIIMLMNGIGIAGNIAGLKRLLTHLKSILAPGGQILLDSTDVSYIYENFQLPPSAYFGELKFQYEYKGKLGNSINWLYIEQEKLTKIAKELGWLCQVIFEDETDAYLARLQIR